VLISTLIASAVGNLFTLGVFDMLLKEKGLPYMPPIRHDRTMNTPTSSLMRTNLVVLTPVTTYLELKQILRTTKFKSYPLVDTMKSKTLLGQFDRDTLTSMVLEHEQKFLQLLATYSGKGDGSEEEDEEGEGGEDEPVSLDVERTSIDGTTSIVMTSKPSSPSGTGQASLGPTSLRSKVVFELPLRSLTPGGMEKWHKKFGEQHLKMIEQETHRLRSEYYNQSADLGRWVPSLHAGAAGASASGTEASVTTRRTSMGGTTLPTPASPQTPATPGPKAPLDGVVQPDPDAFEDQPEDINVRWRQGFDLCPFTVLETVPLSKVHFMFAVLGLSHAWVVRYGRLVGVVTKKDLMQFA